MSIILFPFVACYLAAGAFWWHKIVLPGPAQHDAESWRIDLAETAVRGDCALLIVRANFVLIWPLVLMFGLLWTMVS